MRLLKKFLAPIFVILAISSLLIFSEYSTQSKNRLNSGRVRLAVFRFNSNQILEDTEKGLLEALYSSRQYLDGHLEVRRYCPEGDMPTANMIARNIVTDKFDIVVSISTPGLQVMANNNKAGNVLHVFCAVTDPVVSGVGITGIEANEHPEHLVGIGTFQPVESVIDIAKKMNPRLKKIGVVWCTSETCSEACVLKARVKCRELGIELVEQSVESVTQVYDAALALGEKGVEALWIGGDNVVESAIEMYIGAANKFNIPVFTNNPKHSLKGAMVSLGANYFEVGKAAGNLVAQLMDGLDPKQVRINEVVPEQLYINESVRLKMSNQWRIPPSLKARIDSLIY